jgi:hypothetical protein
MSCESLTYFSLALWSIGVADSETRMDCQWILTFIPYGERWRKQRKLMHSYMHAGAAPTFHPVQIHAAQRLVVDLLVAPQQPNTLPSVVQCNVGQAIIKMVYGIDVRDADSEFTSIPGQLARLLTESVMPGRFLIDLIPSCQSRHSFGCLLQCPQRRYADIFNIQYAIFQPGCPVLGSIRLARMQLFSVER